MPRLKKTITQHIVNVNNLCVEEIEYVDKALPLSKKSIKH